MLPESADGEGPLAYSVTPALGNGLSFDLGTRSIVGTPTASANTATYTYEVSDGSGDTASMELPVTVFDVSIPEIGKHDWWGLEHRSVRIYSGITSPGGFKFRARIPASTGFQANSDTCVGPHPSTANWTPYVASGGSVTLVRCAIGSGATASVEIQVEENTQTGPTVHDLTVSLTVAQALHRGDHDVRYYVPPSSSLFTAPRPSHLATHELDPLLSDDVVHAYLHAISSAAWAGMVTLGRTTSSSTADVVVKAYWNPNPVPGPDLPCKHSIACVHSLGGNSHLANGAILYIEEPPSFATSGKIQEWTASYSDWRKFPNMFEYLPGILMHEYGHVLGLNDTDDTIGYVGVMRSTMHEVPVGGVCRNAPASECGLGAQDRNGLNAIYQNHTRHQ